MKVKEESEKAALKLNFQKLKIMASDPITSWQIDGETMEAVRDFLFLGSKITADRDCSHEIKRRLLLGRKAMPNRDTILKSRDITLPTKVLLVKAMVFLVIMYKCESWTIKKAEWQRIDVFELWCWRRLLRVPWTARKSNQSIVKEVSLEYSLEGLMLKMKVQYFGHLIKELTHWKRHRCWARLKAGAEGEDRGWDGWMASLTRWIWVWASSVSWWSTVKPGMLQSTGLQKVGHDWATELNWYHKHLINNSDSLIEIVLYIWAVRGKSGSDSKGSVYGEGDPDTIPGSERSSGEGNGNPLQYSCLENPMDRGAL